MSADVFKYPAQSKWLVLSYLRSKHMACHYTDNNFIPQILISLLVRLNPRRRASCCVKSLFHTNPLALKEVSRFSTKNHISR